MSKWCGTLWKRQSIFPDRPFEPPPCPLEIEGSLGPNGDLFMLVGLPGSGKSWFSESLIVRDPTGWRRISQDDSGSRSSCETEIGRARGRVILDRCNASSSDRKTWLSLASNWMSSPVCIFFDYDRELCTSRAQSRANHPTLPPGSRVRNAVEQMQRELVRPTMKEGFKVVVVVRSIAAAQDLVRRLSPSVTIFKFPRTPHWLNLGAIGLDDITSDRPILRERESAVITEKLDGANMGFSLSGDRTLLVQNRSHYVNSTSHEQFKRLGSWIESHREELYRVLDRDEHFPERYILFGEWLTATHAIPYSRLPDRFMAFDLYDRAMGRWADRKTLAGILGSTAIQMVPVLHEGDMPTADELERMVHHHPCDYYDGRIEL